MKTEISEELWGLLDDIRKVVCGVKYEVVPSHDIVGYWRGRDTSRRVSLHAL